MDANEITRLLLNLIRKGSIAAVDHAAKRCRVETGGLVSNWLPWSTLRAGTTRTWNPPTVGEQVLLLCPGGDPADGVALCGLFSDAHDAPTTSPDVAQTTYPDGAVISYNHATHALKAILPGGGTVEITAPASVTVKTSAATIEADTVLIDAPETTCTGNLTVQKKLTYQGGMAGSGGAGGKAATIDGGIDATGDIKAGNISLQGHHHDEQGDGAPTSAAKA